MYDERRLERIEAQLKRVKPERKKSRLKVKFGTKPERSRFRTDEDILLENLQYREKQAKKREAIRKLFR